MNIILASGPRTTSPMLSKIHDISTKEIGFIIVFFIAQLGNSLIIPNSNKAITRYCSRPAEQIAKLENKQHFLSNLYSKLQHIDTGEISGKNELISMEGKNDIHATLAIKVANRDT